MPSIYIDDTAIEDIGLRPETAAPFLPSLTIGRDSVSWPGHVGSVSSPFGTVESAPMRFVAEGNVATVAARTALLDGLSDLVVPGLHELRDALTPDRVTRGTLRAFEATIPSPSFVNLRPQIVVEFERRNAARWDVSSQSLVIGSTPKPIPCGTLPHGGRLFLTGTAAGALSTEVRIQYRSMTGALEHELVLLPSLASGEHAIVDFDAQQIVKISTANAQTEVDWVTSGDFFRFSPRFGSRTADVWGTLALTAGAGLYVWRRQWVG